ncbi:outer membrane protein assembly factor BamC [Vibrio rumoiensis]|uniref:Outer membrane protein assembly factor BamC n=1 Tax=Vibrio rumoiensis 1S-45 TaxID=1188252 RepID=A0A1E5E0L0_9VIBR|nr:outer membrane protein assembly factor BamC [Vibrio rumoiensis]OEF23982.1 outer membrane assembly protein BamC [Vibrio rumoiensis 1S-45]
MKFSHQLVVSTLAVLVLSACAGDPEKRRQAKDDFAYLDTTLDQQWVIPSDAQPQFYPQYRIPKGNYTGNTGPDVDIRPPQQVLELIPGARVEKSNNDVTLWLINQDELDKVWDLIHTVANEKNITLKTDTATTIETDWVNLSAEDESFPIAGRYLINRLEPAGRYGFKVSLIEFRENNKNVELTPDIKDRYSSNMVNYITNQYDKQVTEEARIRALELVNKVPVTMGLDRSGLPVIIARAPYNLVWSRLDDVLPQIGFAIEDKNNSQGTIETKYESPDDEVWQKLDVEPLTIENRKYTFLVGDLDNRTSINVTDADGKPISQEELNSLSPVLQAMFDTTNKSSSAQSN